MPKPIHTPAMGGGQFPKFLGTHRLNRLNEALLNHIHRIPDFGFNSG